MHVHTTGWRHCEIFVNIQTGTPINREILTYIREILQQFNAINFYAFFDSATSDIHCLCSVKREWQSGYGYMTLMDFHYNQVPLEHRYQIA